MSLLGEGLKKSSTGLFLNLEPGEKIRVRILAMPTVSAFKNDDSRIRYRFNFPVWDYDSKGVKILSKGRTVITMIDAIADEVGEGLPMACDLIISRKGFGFDTVYTVVQGKIKEELPKDWETQMPDMLTDPKANIPYENFVNGTEPLPKESSTKTETVPIEAHDKEPGA